MSPIRELALRAIRDRYTTILDSYQEGLITYGEAMHMILNSGHVTVTADELAQEVAA